MKKLVMEFLGTFFFLLTIASGGSAFAIGAMLAVWIYIGGYISGGNYNPMVSLALFLRGRLSLNEMFSYWGAQVAGGIVAYLTAVFIRGGFPIPAPVEGISLFQAGFVEIGLAFTLAMIILVAATSRIANLGHIAGFAIGFTIPAIAAIGGNVTGALANPAIAIGSHVTSFLFGGPADFVAMAMYIGAALIGGALAAYAYRYFYGVE